MFDIGIGFSELMLLAVIVIIVVGPEELPSLLRTVGRYVGQVKKIADDFRSQVDDAIKEPMDEIQTSLEGVTENLDDDPFGEEDLIDFEEHNQKILDREKDHKNAKDKKNQTGQDESEQTDPPELETATEKALREAGMDGFEPRADPNTETDSDAGIVSEPESEVAVAGDDVVLAKKSGT